MSDKTPPARILIADDTQFFRVMLSDVLIDQGFEVLAAKDGLEAMEIVQREHPTLALVMVDLEMPRKDGAQVLREIRANPRTERLPVMIVTGKEATSEQRDELRSMGATSFVSKATPSTEIVTRVRSVLEESAGTDQTSAEGVLVNIMVDYLTGEGAFSALCHRLSSQWLDLRTIHPQPAGSTLTMSFTLPGAEDAIQLRGKVIEERKPANDAASGKPPGMRLQFISTHPDTLSDIRDFVQGKSRRT
jgi:CheY-like chemotaxis protein